jgi:hypothetical protein
VTRLVAVSAVSIAVTATLSGVGLSGQQNKLPFCADAPGVKVPAQLMPVDEALKKPDFFTFRARLQMAVAAHDVDAVMSFLDPHFRFGFGGDDGAKMLKEMLSGVDPDLWRSLGRILALGGAFRNESTFEAPYLFSNWPAGTEVFECAAVTGARVAVRRAANVNAELVTRTSYAIVRVVGENRTRQQWSEVGLSTGESGYMHNDYLWGPTALRAIFTLTNGEWRMTALASGD